LRYGEPVDVILRSPTGRVAGLGLESGARLRADAVVCTTDLPVAYETLLADLKPPRAAVWGHYSPSAAVWHVGVREIPDREVAHHNIHFGAQWGSAFDALLKDGRLMPDPSRLVTAGRADGGAAGLFRDLRALAARGYPSDVITEELVTPLDWQRQVMAGGTPFALAHNFTQTGPFRPPNVERRLPGMFFAGSGTVPGVGVPMVPGKLAAERVASYLPGPVR
jgi:phytoene desaturase